jgi:hypothetical protein
MRIRSNWRVTYIFGVAAGWGELWGWSGSELERHPPFHRICFRPRTASEDSGLRCDQAGGGIHHGHQPGSGPAALPMLATPLSNCPGRLRRLFQRHRTTIRSGATPSSFLVAADFNDDGKLDLLAGAGSGSVYLLSGKGDCSFKAASVVGHRYYNLYGCTHAVGTSTTMANWILSFQRGYTRIRQASK